MQAKNQANRERYAHPTLAIAFAAVLAIALLALTACGASGNTPPYSVPVQWHDVSPPTADPIASYAISPDVPGLIVACIGAMTGDMSASPPGPATLWRTRDGGAHWQRLAASGYIATCEVAFPAGGNGTLFAINVLGGQFIQVSHDAGDTWKTIAQDNGNPYRDLQLQFALLAHGVYRDGRLYAAGQGGTVAAASAAATATAISLNPPPAGVSTANAFADLGFSVSSNDGQTFTTVEAAPDPLIQQSYQPLAIAADYSEPGAWFRLVGPGYTSAGGGAAVLEHSTDGGQTWQQSTRHLGELGTYSGYPAAGPGIATLATEPSQPERLCAAFSPMVNYQSASVPSSAVDADIAGSALAGPPPPSPTDVTLAGSDDGGHTWSAAIIGKHRRDYGGAVGSGVSIDPRGNCYLADVSSQLGDTAQDVATIWRLAPGVGAKPASIARIAGQRMVTFAVSLDSASHTPRLVAVGYTYNGPTEIICQGNVCPPEPAMPPSHLIWTPAP